MVRGIRGATTVDRNEEKQITEASMNLLKEMIKLNNIQSEQVASLFISVTSDLSASFPAKALRQLEGYQFVPVMCMKEIDVKDSMPMCIRMMMHINTTMDQVDIHHVYLKEAVGLRPDLIDK
ncbi:chorismate mutase [Bacillus carboniphilus]|uniref:chorismate mutase n=1 Tax=Bacillus carboniphilus TaxID=86663 RepID=A0ABY9JXY8_9BACI|nr:chorismate mutase [Bacillus carboniphilus]WLR44271.1 chorismate mutase [Bacillus carboniphilus]